MVANCDLINIYFMNNKLFIPVSNVDLPMTTATFLVTFGAELLRQAMTGGLSQGLEAQLDQFEDEVSLDIALHRI